MRPGIRCDLLPIAVIHLQIENKILHDGESFDRDDRVEKSRCRGHWVLGRLPIELWREVEGSAVRSPFSSRLFVGRPFKDLAKAEDTLLKQCRDIGRAVFEANEYFTGELLCLTDETMSYRPGAYSHGSCEQMALVMHEAYPAWHETAGALELLQSAHACAVRAYHVELVKEVVIDKVWDFLEVAAHDGSYMGPPHEKPLEKYAVEFRKKGLHHNLHEPRVVDEDDDSGDWYGDGMGAIRSSAIASIMAFTSMGAPILCMRSI
ncbi:hypothetical protein PG997_013632 [Apiospora hydei]|uniref:Uncharacterized protein n=1 Tax=Apiospora hydei TaxID=1337664 RepID=A0ABR1V6T2_9PEZI